MRGWRLLLAVVLAGTLVVPGAAPAYPPITCGRTTVSGTTYVVRTHGPKCGFAVRWVRAFITRHRSPAGFTCKAYGAAVPADCIRNGRKNSYFLATKP